jgi:hypothetical protein
MSERSDPKHGDLAAAEHLYQERCAEANSVLYAAVKTAHTADALEAAYAAHTDARNAALKAYTESRRSILGH